MRKKYRRFVALSILIFCLISLVAIGFVGGKIYSSIYGGCYTMANIRGLWLPDIQELKNYNGKYICINIDNTTNLEELDLTCKHEVGHEIFARYCEKDFDKCKEILKNG